MERVLSDGDERKMNIAATRGADESAERFVRERGATIVVEAADYIP